MTQVEITTNPEQAPPCETCHRRINHKRLTLPFLMTDALQNIFNLERGLIYTFALLWINPKEVTDQFISGDRYRYMNPFRMLFLAATLFALLITAFGLSITEIFGIDPNDPKNGLDIVSNYSDLILMASIPFMSIGSWLAFKKHKSTWLSTPSDTQP